MFLRRTLAAAITTVALVLVGGQYAAATPPPTSAPVVGERVMQPQLPGGPLPAPDSPGMPGGATPQFSVGIGRGLYIYLNQSDQRLLVAGGAAGLAALICGSTALIGCAAAAAALGVAHQWINDRGGICTGSKKRLELWLPPGLTVWIPRCVA